MMNGAGSAQTPRAGEDTGKCMCIDCQSYRRIEALRKSIDRRPKCQSCGAPTDAPKYELIPPKPEDLKYVSPDGPWPEEPFPKFTIPQVDAPVIPPLPEIETPILDRYGALVTINKAIFALDDLRSKFVELKRKFA